MVGVKFCYQDRISPDVAAITAAVPGGPVGVVRLTTPTLVLAPPSVLPGRDRRQSRA